ncbi:MAG: hypothetical protein ABSB82_24555 [Terriglobia bacterium]
MRLQPSKTRHGAKVLSAPVAPAAQATAPKVRGVGFREVPKWRMKCGHERADDPSCTTC